MKQRGVGLLLLGLLCAGCATSRVIQLDTEDGASIVYTPPRSVDPVPIPEDAFREVLLQLVLEVRLPLQSEQQPRSRLQLASWDPALDGGFSFLDASARRRLALSFAWDGVWEGVQGAVAEVVNPLMLKAMISTGMAAYMALLVMPEPITKLVAIALTTYLIAYVGLETFVQLVKGWERLSDETERAVTVEELKDAGHRFGKVMGTSGARVLILALTAALGGASNVAAKGPMLPGFARAALAAETNAGLRLTAAASGGVRSISLAEGVLTMGVASTAVAATAWEGAGNLSPSGGSGEVASVHDGVKNAPGYPSGFKAVQNGTTRNSVSNKALLEKLREVEPGTWVKVYKDGWVGSEKVSLHYFESASGKVFNFKVKAGWSNL
ncbi:hypothetical protein JYK02_23810 [Corallococcus macrosporus]|uniref:Lipoprotein n=1 Tax=Corallococcus macrosporus TaxID=35 RepID=A0ABS3DGV2_9BACT|nr:hypothetical protein [Corallococcus macrosporus]MBN8230544.1 hypothetical protein [Corallococcus macrosporus]